MGRRRRPPVDRDRGADGDRCRDDGPAQFAASKAAVVVAYQDIESAAARSAQSCRWITTSVAGRNLNRLNTSTLPDQSGCDTRRPTTTTSPSSTNSNASNRRPCSYRLARRPTTSRRVPHVGAGSTPSSATVRHTTPRSSRLIQGANSPRPRASYASRMITWRRSINSRSYFGAYQVESEDPIGATNAHTVWGHAQPRRLTVRSPAGGDVGLPSSSRPGVAQLQAGSYWIQALCTNSSRFPSKSATLAA